VCAAPGHHGRRPGIGWLATYTAAEAAAGLRGLDSGAWVGTEGDVFRAQLAGIPPQLDTACAAFGQVAGALDGFAEVLAGAQRQMAGVRADAEQTFGSLTEARAERAGLREPTDGEVAVDPSVAAAFRSAAAPRRPGSVGSTQPGRLSRPPPPACAWGAGGGPPQWERNPGGRADVPNRRPELDPGPLGEARRWASGQLDNLIDFVAEHAEVFRGVAKALRVVGVALGAAAKAGVQALERLGPKLRGWIDDVLKPMLADERGTWPMAER
jgi:hypothetical protein